MALAFNRLSQLRGADVIDEYYLQEWSAEANRSHEYEQAIKLQAQFRGSAARMKMRLRREATIKIQRAFRAYEQRRSNFKKVQRVMEENKRKHLNDMATKIQKTWRGYQSRKKVFDFRARKKYIEEVTKKMEELRLSLEEHAALQRAQEQAKKERLAREMVERLAGRRHHLLGTTSVPGVMHGVTTPVILTVANNDEHKKTKKKKTSKGNGEDGEMECDMEQNDDAWSVRRLPRIIRVPESSLRESKELKEWIENSVGKNPRGLRLKPLPEAVADPDSPGLKKLAQGPFLPKAILEKLKSKPLRPTLRVQTNFYDTKNYVCDEKRKENNMKVSDKGFATAKHVKHELPIYLPLEPYRKSSMLFREDDTAKFVTKKDFKTVLAPISFFDDVEI